MTPKERHTALMAIQAVTQRLEAWRDNAELMINNACVDPSREAEQRWRNERDNYRALLSHMETVKRVITGEC